MGDTSIMWFRRDLRVRDLPALANAARAEHCVPVFVFDDRLLTKGRFPSGSRAAFMLGCLAELAESLRERGGDLVIREGRPEEEIPKLAKEVGASHVHWTADITPWSRQRDQRVIDALAEQDVLAHPSRGAYIVDDPSEVLTQQGKPYSVFTPYWRAWHEQPRREAVRAPSAISLPRGLTTGQLPELSELGLSFDGELGFEPGEAAGRRAMDRFLASGLPEYSASRNRPAGGSSRLSPYLRWGCVSPLELERKAGKQSGKGSGSYRRQLAWREFYGSVLQHFPDNVRMEYQERYRKLEWKRKGKAFDHWREGNTGYPFVDAGMRQLLHEGWMHNRLRLVVGSFLTKDLHLDWRLGEAHFMGHLLDGDMGNNNGGWQWIASVGTDPAPYFQRMFNPMTQQERFDPEGDYVRRWVPELTKVPDKLLSKPWEMSAQQQADSGCVIGEDYPEPIVDHAEERRVAQERYRSAS